MNIEDRLSSAAAELNQVARRSAPPPFGSADRIRPWLAFAATFAVVLAILGIPLILSNPGQGPTDGGPVGTTDTTTTLIGETTTSEGSVVTLSPTTTDETFVCPASDYGPPTTVAYEDPADPRNLSEAAASKLTAIALAAGSCDYEQMVDLAAEDFITSFGGGGVENIGRWHDEGEDPYPLILDLLNMVHGVQEMPDGERLFVWPAAFAYDSWDEIPEEFVTPLLRIYSQEELDQIATFGSYAGWRLGITESGEWLFFVAGD